MMISDFTLGSYAAVTRSLAIDTTLDSILKLIDSVNMVLDCESQG